MPSIRRRFYVAAGTLVGLQVVGTALGFLSWWRVNEAIHHQLRTAEQRSAVLQLGSAAREVYVHQAHTFIEGGPGHLDHYAGVVGVVDGRLADVMALPLPAEVEMEPVRAALANANAWFAFQVAPAARAGTLDRSAAVALHAESEKRSLAVERAISSALASLDEAQAREVANVTRETTRAWVAVALLTIGGAGLAGLVARRLARTVVTPFASLARAARAFARGETEAMPSSTDEEVNDVAAAFNQMTAQVRAAEARRVDTERLAALGEMSAAVAHELMNPLTVVLAEPAIKRPELAQARAEVEHMTRVVQGLLGFARPTAEPTGPLDVVASVQDAVDRMTPFADMKQVSIRLGESIPATVEASRTAARQVLDNLLQNAVQASEPGTTIEVTVGRGPVVEILDRGAGIPEPMRQRLYEPFVTGRHEGTGLGLAIAARIVRAQGGTLTHRARDGGGTVARWELSHG